MNNKGKEQTIKYFGSVMVLSAGILWGFIGLFVRGLSKDGFSSMEIVLARSLVSALIMFIGLLIIDKKLLIIKVKDIWCFIGTGVISLTLFNVCYFTTIQRTSMAVAAILLYTSPIFVVLMSALFFKEKISRRKIIAMLLAFGGCFFVTGVLGSGGMVMNLSGILIGVCAGIGYALYSIFGRVALERGYASPTISFYTFLFSTLGTLCFVPAGGLIKKVIAGNILSDIILLIGIAVVATILPYLLYTFGLSGMENGKAAIMVSVEPVMAAVLGMIVYKERLTITGYLGVVLVLAAIVLLNLGEKTKEEIEKS